MSGFRTGPTAGTVRSLCLTFHHVLKINNSALSENTLVRWKRAELEFVQDIAVKYNILTLNKQSYVNILALVFQRE